MESFGEGERHFFRNLCHDFEKVAQKSKKPEEILQEAERFLSACREIRWPEEKTARYHKQEAEKNLQKVITEARQYANALENSPQKAIPNDLVDAISVAEKMASDIDAR